ncbi:MAG: helix-turn-helix domain-containing protein [Treponema sp.]|jgi:transcriptional regulator with XRE-family HTH domain|nr:helix-turn-helix domain-containing protein [Treponema sp.]
MGINDFWDRVRLLIKKRKTTQEQIAGLCGIPYATFRGWIWKDIFPPLTDAYNISRVLGVTVEYLLIGQDTKDKRAELKIRKARSLLHKVDEKLEKMVVEDEKTNVAT